MSSARVSRAGGRNASGIVSDTQAAYRQAPPSALRTEQPDVVFAERLDQTQAGEKAVDLPCTGVFTIRDGKIASWRDQFDLGRIDQVQRVVEDVGVRIQRLRTRRVRDYGVRLEEAAQHRIIVAAAQGDEARSQEALQQIGHFNLRFRSMTGY
ncbi:MAG: hypothetical protein JRH10_01280 [Deltaproteobacteria bacterium]|nr:hypothetical protein [Deltaproteobacteria bacterium]